MTELIIGDISIPLPRDFSITLNYENPLFLDSGFNKTYGYSFQLPASPELNALFLHGERQNTRENQRKHTARILFSGVVMVKGHAIIEQGNERVYSVFIQQEAFDLVEKLKLKNLRDLEVETVELWSESETLSLSQKLNRWKEHIEANIAENETTGAVKFPRIQGRYEEDQASISNLEFPLFTNYANQYVVGELYLNPIIENDTKPFGAEKQWLTTVAPVPRIAFVLEKIVQEMGINLVNGEFMGLEEFQRLVGFAGVVMDKFEFAGGFNTNTHGRTYNLKDLLPKNNLFYVFELIRDVFDCFFVFENNSLNIFLSDNLMKIDAEDMTQYSANDYKQKFNDKKSFVFNLNDFSRLGPLRALVSTVEELDPIFSTYTDFTANPNQSSVISKTLKYNLFNHRIGLIPGSIIWLNYAQWSIPENERPEFNHFVNIPSFTFGNNKLEFFRSNEVNNANSEATSLFHIMWYWGIRKTPKLINDISPDVTYEDAMISGIHGVYFPLDYNFNEYEILALNNKSLGFQNVDINGNIQEGLFETFHNRKIELLNNSKEVEKSLFLPPHKIVEISKWRKPKHRIENPMGTFVGFVKKMSVTITTQSISQTKITYVSPTV
jgi:hypothetical protein